MQSHPCSHVPVWATAMLKGQFPPSSMLQKAKDFQISLLFYSHRVNFYGFFPLEKNCSKNIGKYINKILFPIRRDTCKISPIVALSFVLLNTKIYIGLSIVLMSS